MVSPQIPFSVTKKTKITEWSWRERERKESCRESGTRAAERERVRRAAERERGELEKKESWRRRREEGEQ